MSSYTIMYNTDFTSARRNAGRLALLRNPVSEALDPPLLTVAIDLPSSSIFRVLNFLYIYMYMCIVEVLHEAESGTILTIGI